VRAGIVNRINKQAVRERINIAENQNLDGFEEQKYTPKYDSTIWNTKNARAKPGDTLTGTVIDITEDKLKGPDGKEKTVESWTIQNAAGDKVKTAAHSQLIGKLQNAEVGDMVKITYKGLVELPGGKAGQGYDVLLKKKK
jgi:hypothetical protein